MKKVFASLSILTMLLVCSMNLTAQTITINLPDSPPATTNYSNTLQQNSWTTFNRTDLGVITSVSISFTWATDQFPNEAWLRLRHPDMTVTNLIAAGVTNSGVTIVENSTTAYTLTTTAFNNKAIAGDWALWIEDLYSNGGHRATNVSISIGYTALPMTFVSTSAYQVGNAVAPGTTNAQVLMLNIVAQNSTTPLNTSSFTFSTNGTSDTLDLLNAHVYYTGNSALFEPVSRFGTVLAGPAGTFTVAGNQNLVHGNNFFWLAFDVDSNAQANNLIDAEFLSITVDNVPRVPTTTAPIGSRRVVPQFAGNYNVGVGNAYTTLGAILHDISSVGMSANTNIFITSDLTEPTQIYITEPPVGRNEILTIRPAANLNPVVTFSNNSAAFFIDGFDNLVINGSNSLTENTRNLTFTNNSTGTSSGCFYIRDVDNIVLSNSIIQNGSSAVGIGISMFEARNAVIKNNKVQRAQTGILVMNHSSNTMIKENELGSTQPGFALSTYAIRMTTSSAAISSNNYEISDNIIDGMTFTGADNSWHYVVSLFNAFNGSVVRNTFKNIVNTGGHQVAMRVNTSAPVALSDINLLVANNTMYNFTACTNSAVSNGNMYAFYNSNTTNVRILHNTINFGTGSAGLYTIVNRHTTNTENYQFRNNIIIANQGGSTSRRTHMIDATHPANPFSHINNNIYYITGTSFASHLGTTLNALDLWKTALGGGAQNSDNNSITKLPMFAAAGTPYLAGSLLIDSDYNVPLIPEITNDIDNEIRTQLNNKAGADIMIPANVGFTVNLPLTKQETYNQSTILNVMPQLSNEFQDGINRTPPPGDMAAMVYKWYHNGSEITSGQNSFTINRNVLTIASTDTLHNGQYFCNVDYLGINSNSNTCQLSIITLLKPTLISPADNAMNITLNTSLTWNTVLYATNYQVVVSRNDSFTDIIMDSTVAGANITISGLGVFTQYYWRVKALNATEESEWSVARKFTTIPPPILPPTLITPINNAINVQTDVDLIWYNFESATSYTIQVAMDTNFFSTFIFEALTDTIKSVPGLATSTKYFWRVRSHRTVEISDWSIIHSFTTGTGLATQTIPLTSGWNMFSANVTPQNPAMSNILTPLLGNMMLIKNVYGQVFAPPFQASLTNWNTSHAYQARMTTPANLVLQGIPIVPEMTPITLDYLGWYWLPYYRTSSMPVGNALATIQNKYLQIKSITGQVHQPPFITTLQNLEPNMGYMIRMTATDGTLTYPSNAIIKAGSDPVHIPQPKVFVREAAVTGKTAVIALELDNMQDGDEVGVFTRDGLLVGSSVWANGSRGVVVWGDDEYTNEKDGAAEGEELIVKIWSAEAKNIGKVESISLNDMTTNARQFTLTYETDAVYLLKGTADVAEAAKLSISPQPASDELFVNIPYLQDMEYLNQIASVKLYSQAGQLAIDTEMQASGNVIKLNTSTLSSGVYQMIININGKTYSDKVVIVK